MGRRRESREAGVASAASTLSGSLSQNQSCRCFPIFFLFPSFFLPASILTAPGEAGGARRGLPKIGLRPSPSVRVSVGLRLAEFAAPDPSFFFLRFPFQQITLLSLRHGKVGGARRHSNFHRFCPKKKKSVRKNRKSSLFVPSNARASTRLLAGAKMVF